MAKKATAKKIEKTATAKTEAKATKPKKEKTPREDRSDWQTFALRLPKNESAALHDTAGSGRASRVMRSLAAAFVAGDDGAFKAVVKEAREARQ